MLRKRSIATKSSGAQGALPERRASACARTSLLLPATTSKAARARRDKGQTGTGSDKIWLKLLARR